MSGLVLNIQTSQRAPVQTKLGPLISHPSAEKESAEVNRRSLSLKLHFELLDVVFFILDFFVVRIGYFTVAYTFVLKKMNIRRIDNFNA